MVDRDRAMPQPTVPAARSTGSRAISVSPELEDRLSQQRIAWLTTVRPDGAPHVVPVWFLWDGATFIVFSKPTARKVRNIAAEGRVMLAIGDAEADFDVQLVEGDAHLIEHSAIDVLDERLVRKYGPWMADIALSPAEFAATYSQVIRVVPTRFLPWRGRTGGRPVSRVESPRSRQVARPRSHPLRAAGAGMTFTAARPCRRERQSAGSASGRPRLSFPPRGSRLQ
jgi:PPOX class probable F420-dependent enzyme